MDKSLLVEWYRKMVLIRRFEERCDALYQLEGKIKGFLHLYIGQEAIAVGTIGARSEHDHVITGYRDHGHALTVGVPAKYVMAELMGKATGVSGGRGGSMHIADRSRNYWGGYGIVGGQIPLGVGLGLAEKYRHSQNVALIYFGEGSTNIAYFHESLNLAGVWQLPCIFVCENNKYGMGTSVEKASAVTSMIDKAKAYGMDGKRVDGMNVFDVYQATQDAMERIRQGEGPQFLEMMAYRYEGHSVGDRKWYRTEGEFEMWRDSKDPIAHLERALIADYGATAQEFNDINESVLQEVEEAVQFADESPVPDPSTLFDYIYPVQGEAALS